MPRAGRSRSTASTRKTRKRMEASFNALSDAMVMRDAGALIDFLRADPAARPGAMGGVGYCMGGRHVLCAAGHFPDRFRRLREPARRRR